MKLEWAFLAEGVGRDSRGVITVIGLNQNVLIPLELPTKTTRVMILHLTDVEPEQTLGFTMKVTDPAGEPLAIHGGEMKIGQPQFPDLPIAADIPVDLVISAASYGTYTVEVEFKEPGGETQSISEQLFVMRSPAEGGRYGETKRPSDRSSRPARQARGSRIVPGEPGGHQAK